MSRAILIVGGSLKFKISAEILRSFLQDRAKVVTASPIYTAYLSTKDFQQRFCEELEKALLAVNDKPILIDYIGHGGLSYWSINEDVVIHYDFIAQQLARVQSPLLFINDCCHAFSIVDSLEKHHVSKAHVGLIASCRHDQESAAGHINLSKQIESAWARHMAVQACVKKASPFCPNCGTLITKINPDEWFYQDVQRWGRNFDYHFFPHRGFLKSGL